MLNLVLKQALNGAVTDLAAGVYATQSQSLYTLTVAGSDTIPDGLKLQRDGTVVISGLESGATWQYRYDGINWTAGSGSSFELAEGSYAAVQVRQIDLAGNEGPFFDGSSSADLGATVIDQTAPDLGLVDIVDTGISDSDGVTSTDTFTVTGLESGAD